MAKIEGWSEDEIEGRSSKLASLIESVWRAVTNIFFNNKVKANAKTITLNDISELPTIWADELDNKVIANLGLAVYDGAEKIFKDLGVEDEQAITAMLGESGFTDFVEDYLQQASNRLRNTADEIWHDVRAALLEGYAENEDYTELAARIKHVAMMSDSRAMLIARTEMHAALEAGAYEQAKLVDPTGTKTWLATEDDRTRPTHVAADGQSAEIDGTFSVGLSKLRYPGDPLGAANETINCRCTATYDLDPSDEELERLVAEAAITAGAHGFNPFDHPRGKDGKFIKHGSGAFDFLTGHEPHGNYEIIQALGKIDKAEWDNLKPEHQAAIKKTLSKVDTYTGKKFVKKKLDSFGESDDASTPAVPATPTLTPEPPKETESTKALKQILNDDFAATDFDTKKKAVSKIEQKDYDALTPAEKKKVKQHAEYTSYAALDTVNKLEGNSPGGTPYKAPTDPFVKALTDFGHLDAQSWAKLTPAEKQKHIDALEAAGIAKSIYANDIAVWENQAKLADVQSQIDALDATESSAKSKKAIKKLLNEDFDATEFNALIEEQKAAFAAIKQSDWNALSADDRLKLKSFAGSVSYASEDITKRLDGNAPGGKPYKPITDPYVQALTDFGYLNAESWAKLTPAEKQKHKDALAAVGVGTNFFDTQVAQWEKQVPSVTTPTTAPTPSATPTVSVPDMVPSLANATPADVYKTNPDGHIIAIGQDGKNRIRWNASKKKFQQEELQPSGKWAAVGPPMSKKDTYALLANNKKNKTGHWRKPKPGVVAPTPAPAIVPVVVPAVTPTPKDPYQSLMDDIPPLQTKDDWDKLTPAQKMGAVAKLDNIAKNTADVSLAIEANDALNNIKKWTASAPSVPATPVPNADHAFTLDVADKLTEDEWNALSIADKKKLTDKLTDISNTSESLSHVTQAIGLKKKFDAWGVGNAPSPNPPTTVADMFNQLFNGGKTPPVFLGADPKKPFKSNKKDDKPLTAEMLRGWLNDPTVPADSVLGHSYDNYGEHHRFVKDSLGGLKVQKWDPHSQSWKPEGGFLATAKPETYQNYFKNSFETTFVSGDLSGGPSGVEPKKKLTFEQAGKVDGPYVPDSTNPGMKATELYAWTHDDDIPVGSILAYVENEDGETFRLIKTEDNGIKSEVWSYSQQVWNPAGKMNNDYEVEDFQDYINDIEADGGVHYSGVTDPATMTSPANPTPAAAPVLSFADLYQGMPTETTWDKATFDTFTSVAPKLSLTDARAILESGVTPPKPVVLAVKHGGTDSKGVDNYYRLVYDSNGLTVELAHSTSGPWEELIGPLGSGEFDKQTVKSVIEGIGGPGTSKWSATFDVDQIPKTSTTAPSPASPIATPPSTPATAISTPSVPDPTAPVAPLPPKIKTWTQYTAKKQYKNAPYSAKNSDGSVTIARTADGKSELVYTGGHNGVFMHVELDDNGVPTKVVATDKQKLAPLAKGKTWFPVFGETNPPPKAGAGKKASSTAPLAAPITPGTLGNGPSDISGFDQTFKTAVHDAAKSKGLYFSDDAEKKFKTLKQVALANNISIAQAIKIMDEVSSAKFNVPNGNAYENDILAWLQTPAGSAISQGLPVPKGALPPTPAYSLLSGINPDDIVPPKSESDKYSYPVFSMSDGVEMWEEMTKNAPISPESAKAIKAYSDSATATNQYLYSPTGKSEPWTVAPIQQGMRKTTKPMVVHRGVGMDAFGLSYGDDPSSLLGSTVFQPNYQSSSYGGKAAFSGAIQFIVEAPPGTPAVFMSGKLSSYGHGEREILLAAGLYYEILEVKPSNDKPKHQWDVRARVVPKPAGI